MSGAGMSFRADRKRWDIRRPPVGPFEDIPDENSALLLLYGQLSLCSACVYIDDGAQISVITSINGPPTGSAWDITSFDNPWVMLRPRISSIFHKTTAYTGRDTWASSAANAELRALNGDAPAFGLLSSTHTGPGELVVLLTRPQRRGEFLGAEIELANQALSAIEQICMLQRQLDQTRTIMELHEGALDALSLALIRFSEDGEITYNNRSAAEAMADSGGGTGWNPRNGAGKWPGDLGAAANGNGGLPGWPGGDRATAPSVALLQTRDGARQVLIGYNDEKIRAAAVRSHLARNFGLSPTELDLAIGLLEGRSLAEIADAKGASINTIRVHLRNALKKTGQGRQAGFVALMARTPALRAD